LHRQAFPVYVIHWNAPEWCVSAVDSILRSEASVDLTVIDNSAQNGHSLHGRLPPSVRILEVPRNRGYSGGANRAVSDCKVRYPKAEFIVIGSHDMHLAPGCLTQLLSVAEAHPQFGVLAPGLAGPKESSGGVWSGHHAYHLPLDPSIGLVERDWLTGTCLFIRMACLVDVGRFDERFGSYVEDVDFCLRVRDAGWKVGVVPSAKAWGLGTASPQARAMIYANTVLLRAKRGGLLEATRALGNLAFNTTRCAVGTMALWREPRRRRESKHFLKQRVTALQRLDMQLIGHVLREPDAFAPAPTEQQALQET
jgi:hypothetical protein